VVAWLGRFTTEADLSPASYVTHNLRVNKINRRGRRKGATLGRVFDDKVRHKRSTVLDIASLSEQGCASLFAVDRSELCETLERLRRSAGRGLADSGLPAIAR